MDSQCGAQGQGPTSEWLGMYNANISIWDMWLACHDDLKSM